MRKKKVHIYFALFFAFLIGNYHGYIALWINTDQPEPDRVFPYSVSSLPPADQKALKEGIRLESEADVRKLLEDYLS